MKKISTTRKSYMAALSIAVASSAIVATVPAYHAEAASKKFTDVNPKSVHAEAIQSLVERGIISGFTDHTFRPGNVLTRAEAAKMIALSIGLDTTTVSDPAFTDVKKGVWYYEYVAALSNSGLLDGFSDKTFRPGQNLTRAEIAKLLVKSYELDNGETMTNPFTDVQAGRWFTPYIQSIYSTGITKGKTKTLFVPDEGVTRGEFATFVVRAENHLAKSKEAVKEASDKIISFVGKNEVFKDEKGKITAKTEYNPTSRALTITAYDEKGLNQLQQSGFFSKDLLTLGVHSLKIADNSPVDITKDYATAKRLIQSQLQKKLDTSTAGDGIISVNQVPIRLYATSNEVKFWEDFTLTLHIMLP
ncbi:S-layer homology domain-containing protein [Sporosarcina gallistercoris]|uniref:S-layer homology domain-containing protein n=1 Tax=Sporosarcina gallistercoris TaxID=2762245 RepID=A0ABR8PMJ1_9BACL|nr:S-layer homology domain-containing protein [Sporosarcina gallistercoris]MBD7909407.1 S-layer homology domain-containing protein [Sporosarcina gallistercoris]